MRFTMRVLLLVLTAAMWSGAQTSAQAASSEPVADATDHATTQTSTVPQFGTRYPRYKIGSGDTFDVNFELSPEFNQTVTVQPDGFITLKGVGDVQVAGQTVPQLTETLKKSYGTILNDPQIVVMLKDFEKPYFIADGQVARPGKYEMRGNVTVTEAVAMAGGFMEAAKHSQVLLFRRIDDQWTEAKVINVKKMIKDRNLHEDMQVRPGDMIVVPKNTISKIQRYIPNSSVGGFTQLGAIGVH